MLPMVQNNISEGNSGSGSADYPPQEEFYSYNPDYDNVNEAEDDFNGVYSNESNVNYTTGGFNVSHNNNYNTDDFDVNHSNVLYTTGDFNVSQNNFNTDGFGVDHSHANHNGSELNVNTSNMNFNPAYVNPINVNHGVMNNIGPHNASIGNGNFGNSEYVSSPPPATTHSRSQVTQFLVEQLRSLPRPAPVAPRSVMASARVNPRQYSSTPLTTVHEEEEPEFKRAPYQRHKRNRNGGIRKSRDPRPKLVNWDDDKWQLVALGLVHALGEDGVDIDFDRIAKFVGPDCSGSALQQAILKLRTKLNAAGRNIAPVKMRWSRRKPNSFICALKRPYREEDRKHLSAPHVFRK